MHGSEFQVFEVNLPDDGIREAQPHFILISVIKRDIVKMFNSLYFIV